MSNSHSEQFAPMACGTRSEVLSISDNAPGSTHTVALSGKEVAAGPAVDLAPASVTFPGQPVGTCSTAQTVTLTNTGGARLTIASLAVTTANESDFAQTATSGSSVAAGANRTISATSTPSASGSGTTSVSISDNAASSPQTVSLTGRGTAPAISLSPTGLSFSSQTVGTTSAAQTVAPTTRRAH